MIIGSGLIARAFSEEFSKREDVCIYAAGVSNSNCIDASEFEREGHRLEAAMRQTKHCDIFVYFGTCSVADPEAQDTPYVQHKLAMEQLVSTHSQSLIFRLPQVAGNTPNPHTLMNFLYARISRSESFQLWNKAKRNIVDSVDVAAIAREYILNASARNRILNIANAVAYPMPYIVHVMEEVVGKQAVYRTVNRGSEYPIDISVISPMLGKVGVTFGNGYLEKVVRKYYVKAS